MRIAVAATASVAIPTLDWLHDSDNEIALIISQPDRRAGRGLEVSTSPIVLWAKEHGIQVFQPQSPSELIGVIDDLDLVLTIAYGVLIPEVILNLPRFGFLNLHFSLLPAYRGAAPVQRAIQNGENRTGVTVFALDRGMDTGAIYSTRELFIQPHWRSDELMAALAQIGPEAVSRALDAINAGVQPLTQKGPASYAPKIRKEEAEIDWNQTAVSIARSIRAFYPAPIAWTSCNGYLLKITKAIVTEASLSPGEISFIKGRVVVGCGDGSAISLLTVLPAGKREMNASDWARGSRFVQGDRLG